jgi:hypothetical protein
MFRKTTMKAVLMAVLAMFVFSNLNGCVWVHDDHWHHDHDHWDH